MVEKGKIAVCEVFLSINGEVPFAGYSSVFFRVFGCNLRCKWCDTKYAYEADETCKWFTVAEAVGEIERVGNGAKRVTITGGEPLMECNKTFMRSLFVELLGRGWVVCVETNGSVDYSYWIEQFCTERNFYLVTDWKCPSSGETSSMLPANIGILRPWDIVKCVVAGDEDLEEVQRVINTGVRAQVVVSPCFGKVILSTLPDFVVRNAKHGNVSCQVQLHKIFWEHNRRGV